MSKLLTKREELGKLLQNNVKRIDDSNYKVKSSSGNEVYSILATTIGWICSCPDHMFRGVKCKHVYAVEFSFELRKSVEVRKIVKATVITHFINTHVFFQ